jgi:hypothetical protein
MTEAVELVCKRVHMPYANVRIPANTLVAIGPPWLAEALCARGFFEKVPEDILKQEREAEAKAKAEDEAKVKAEDEAKVKAEDEAKVKAEKKTIEKGE